MKRIWALCLVLCMVISMLAGCSSGTGNESGDDAGNNNDNSKTVSSTNADGTKESGDASGSSNQAAPVTLDERTGFPLAVGYPKEGGEISVWTVWSSNFLLNPWTKLRQ